MTLTHPRTRPAPRADGDAARRLRGRAAPARLVRAVPVGVVVFAAGLVARLAVILRHGGLHGSFGYDAAVYFGAADALVHGRMPYRDFVLLHPPGLMLALTPFAALTHVMSDEAAFTVGVLTFSALGALNGVLVVRVCRRLGFSGSQAAAGGLFYALWFGSVGAEYLTKLEPLGNLALLLALLGVLRAQDGNARGRGGLRASALAGVPLGFVISVKIWWIVPVVGIVAWHIYRMRSARAGVATVGGMLLAVAAVDLPFFAAAPRAMWGGVVADQLGRHANAVSPLIRLGDLSTVPRLVTHPSTALLAVSSVAVVAMAALVVRRAWALPAARPFGVLLVIQLIVVMVAPSWFSFYTDYVAVAAAVTVAAAARRPSPTDGPRRRPALPAGRVATAAVAVLTVATLAVGTSTVRPFHGAAQLARSVRGVTCVMSDSPMGLIELDALSRGLAAGCRNWIDVTGRTYGPDYASATRVANTRWQRDLRAYLRSGGAVIIVRATGTGLDHATRAAIMKDGVLARAGDHTVYATVGR